jgi:hypothetical protein
MIIDRFLEWAFNQLNSIFQQAPLLEVPENYQEGMSIYTEAVSNISDMGAWVNFPALALGTTMIISAHTIAIVIKLGRQAVSVATGGGGATK